MAPKPREGAGSNCSRGSWPSTSAGVDGSACYGGSMTAPHKNAARPPATKACLGDDVLVVEMFAKELTPSDVGKLNRLVIPKKHAMQHFSHAAPPTQEELSIVFVDRDGRWWTFRYCYWKSSQSFVFTKGWNRFVKEKRLRAKDTVTFYRCVDDRNGTYCLIDTIRHAENDRNEEDDKAPKDGLSFERRMKQQEYDDKDELTRYGDGEVVPMESKKKLRLFGEWIKIE
ncbi:B3 domain-containing protein Os04g0581400-like [Zingiber officinale]|uniref:TF-B3 domain-containing protein n=1 Tax=Zingiber officinale TaxID=94328 RepID=A0A8J5FQ90_ZINOF|nr:B3 domain-containing protein Os04g0581400-like [Zingiber officinale]KAG6493166.1 hypothetical protein ZIOFF_048143 [Zingiber officinale]